MQDPSIENFCENMRCLRAAHRLSLTQMSAKLHYTVKTLRRIESGEIPDHVCVDILFAIKNEFGFKPSQMFIAHEVERVLCASDAPCASNVRP